MEAGDFVIEKKEKLKSQTPVQDNVLHVFVYFNQNKLLRVGIAFLKMNQEIRRVQLMDEWDNMLFATNFSDYELADRSVIDSLLDQLSSSSQGIEVLIRKIFNDKKKRGYY